VTVNWALEMVSFDAESIILRDRISGSFIFTSRLLGEVKKGEAVDKSLILLDLRGIAE
jgi:hypothetical protein